MKGLGRKVSFLAIMAVIATAAMGAGYTLWYEDLEVHADVDTGTLDGSIRCFIVLDNDELSGGWFNPDYPSPDPLKDIGDVDGEVVSAHEFHLTVTNAYPGYAFDCEYRLLNTGTVAWHIEIQEILVMLPDGTELEGTCNGNICTFGQIGPTDPDASPIYVELNDDRGCQIHPGEREDGSFIVGVNQSALEGVTYSIWVKFQVNQWNESDWYGCGDDNPDRDGPVLPVQSVPGPI